MYAIAATACFAAALTQLAGLPYSLAVLLPLLVYLATGGWRAVKVFALTIRRDIRGAIGLARFLLFVRRGEKKGHIIPDFFHDTAQKFPQRTALICVETGERLTFAEAEQQINKVARVFAEKGYKKGDVVAIVMESEPQYVLLWLGLSKIGVVSSLINHNLENEPLAHCLKICNARAIIYGKVLEGNLKTVKDRLTESLDFYCYGDQSGIEGGLELSPLLDSASGAAHPRRKDLSMQDPLFYIYTSGTTGLPKAAVIKHTRFLSMTIPFKYLFSINEDDVNYLALPLYHSNAGIAGVGPCIFSGSALAIRKRFSASNFFKDCDKYGATMTHYIGEVCRYLLAQPRLNSDASHKLKYAFGNGLRPGIWKQFQSRFGIGTIGEFYGSTEGNANMLNFEGVPGAVGFNSVILSAIFPIRLFRVNMESGELLRDSNGLAILCGPNEPGQLIGKIIKGHSSRDFTGYINQSETSKKIARDVFVHGDSCFKSGDILVQDELGYFYFQDRHGDTFRWKGENVSTMEVETVISDVLQLKAVAVYGVDVPGSEGKAGMCAVAHPADSFDAGQFHEKMKSRLPAYAQPVFIRLMDALETTGTHKLTKTNLKKEGYNLDLVQNDAIYFLPPRTSSYRLLDNDAYNKIKLCQMGF